MQISERKNKLWMWIWAAMSIFLLGYTTFAFIAIDSGMGFRVLVLALLSLVMFILRYKLSKRQRV
ncbi:hypothetical protein CLV25_1266 [Acetobacteroides hydrogenigenes]|uniref:Uncharacterized protein n=1 Tax=Acetobacteroides hydrogenigenes TaxID=979970 RepID=A0A4R2E124_9BACT|nr:hypothetical protein CLV25_1266 [Acetobacteroides hydrogenigenes]